VPHLLPHRRVGDNAAMGRSAHPVYLRVLEDLRMRIREGVLAGSSVVVVERAHLSGGQPVETADIVIPADRYRLRYRFAVPGQPA
jgi:DNA-binding GntR family transcriptional regulator